MTAREAIRNALSQITRAAQQPDKDYPDDDIGLSGAWPVAELARSGFTFEVLDEGDADTLPRLMVQSNKGRLEIERCPFAPLALLSDETWDGAEVAGVLERVGITPVKLNDFEGVPDWHGISAISWLFPERLSEALSRLDALREVAEPQRPEV